MKKYKYFLTFATLLIIVFACDAYSTYLVISSGKGIETNALIKNFELISLLFSAPIMMILLLTISCIYITEIHVSKETLKSIILTNNKYFVFVYGPYAIFIIKLVATLNNMTIYFGHKGYLHHVFIYFENPTHGLFLVILFSLVITLPILRIALLKRFD